MSGDNVESRTLVVGARFLITLPGLGAAGYRWSATIDDPTIVAVEGAASAIGREARPPGASRDETFAICALAVGETKVRFAQARSFEPGRAPNAVRELRIRVMPADGS
ncbi:MAG: protease inhibitor I42 family protein [Methylocella sp.]